MEVDLDVQADAADEGTEATSWELPDGTHAILNGGEAEEEEDEDAGDADEPAPGQPPMVSLGDGIGLAHSTPTSPSQVPDLPERDQ